MTRSAARRSREFLTRRPLAAPAGAPAALLLAAALGGACGGEPEAPDGTGPLGALTEAESPAPDGGLPAGQPEAAPADLPQGVYFELGPGGLLRPRTFDLPAGAPTRDAAEAVVRRVVADSGTVPDGVEVLEVFVSGRGVAVLDFSGELLSRHPGGLAAEELTVYSLSHSLVEGFPAIAEVRILVDGKQEDTLAGHLDLRSGFGRAPERLLPPEEDSGG